MLVTPTSPMAAPSIGATTAMLGGQEIPLVRAFLDLTLPFNLTGQPAISIPCGFTPEGLPVGLQLVGPPWDEATLFRAAAAYESCHRLAYPKAGDCERSETVNRAWLCLANNKLQRQSFPDGSSTTHVARCERCLGVDTRSDIFSLGVLSYKLLTGSTPISHKRVTNSFPATYRVVAWSQTKPQLG